MTAQRWKASLAVLLAAAFICASASAADPSAPAASAPSAAPPPIVVRQGTPIPDDPVPVVRHPRPEAVATDAGETTPEAQPLNPMAHRCFVRDVMAFIDRTRVRCHNAAEGRFVFFAVDTGQPVAGTLLEKAWRSMRSGKPLQLKYAPTPDLNPPNCRVKDCRRLIDAAN
ncbi:MAG: hypothetical protein ACK5YG_02780 [Alphaproteobacteria bacterium]|jgi:hypothetical protein